MRIALLPDDGSVNDAYVNSLIDRILARLGDAIMGFRFVGWKP